uniref:deoxynucleoside triphosphate triphosphohydrolase SAMHD1-like isoform X1 n=3 Tax=Semicossyphus pulcher TaxID=241346 RepID=UPI0037E970E9
MANQGKVFNDPIHGHVDLHPLLIKIIDTPQFQRLRNLKQLGGVYFVYPGASHNRFEHSIGAAHLAGELVRALKARQPELNITERDILCVEIAGLCHDLGHGPFSHLFDGIFVPMVLKKKEDMKKSGKLDEKKKKEIEEEIEQLKTWKHEKGSCDMFDHLVKCNNLEQEMKDCGLELPEDLTFIKEMIMPKQIKDKEWPHEGRGKDKAFLYEIVSNKSSGVDVDKFDYLARDCYHLGVQNNFDHNRFLKFARVCEVEGKEWKHICIRDKMMDNMYDLFHARHCNHRRACQHKVNNIIGHMTAEAFLKADEHIKVKGSGGKMFTISTAIGDMEAYTKLTDNLFEQILNSSDEELKDAKEILEKIIARKFYRFLGDKTLGEEDQKLDKEAAMDQISEWKKELAGDQLTPEDFVVEVITFDYGKGGKDPVQYVYFYSKDNPDQAKGMSADQKSRIRTVCFSEKLIRVYYKNPEEQSLETAKKRFKQVEMQQQRREQRAQKRKASADSGT